MYGVEKSVLEVKISLNVHQRVLISDSFSMNIVGETKIKIYVQVWLQKLVLIE